MTRWPRRILRCSCSQATSRRWREEGSHILDRNAEAAGYFALELSYDLALNDALAAANSALQLQPGNIPALAGRGFAYFRFGEMNEARADLKRVTASSPTTPRGFETRANAHYMLDEFPAALQDFAEAIRLKPDYGVA